MELFCIIIILHILSLRYPCHRKTVSTHYNALFSYLFSISTIPFTAPLLYFLYCILHAHSQSAHHSFRESISHAFPHLKALQGVPATRLIPNKYMPHHLELSTKIYCLGITSQLYTNIEHNYENTSILHHFFQDLAESTLYGKTQEHT